MIGTLNPHVLTGTCHARLCTRTDCGLSERHAEAVTYDVA
jgi:hypothetical protein